MTKGTSKSSKMGKDKLIAKLDEWFETVSDYGEEEDGQAYRPDPPLIYANGNEVTDK